MKPGDTVQVIWEDGFSPMVGTVIEHDPSRDWIHIKTDAGGEMNGQYKTITMVL